MTILPARFRNWFAAQGWQPHPHQLALLDEAEDHLLIAPTGGGKTLAGFLPSLIDLSEHPHQGLHTLYVSPLKALTVDVARNLNRPIADMALKIRVEDRTGDTPSARRGRQRVDPPAILLTTPESLTLMLTYPEAARIFGNLKRVVLDELHSLAESKRGDQLMLGLARLRHLTPGLVTTGLSATVDHPKDLAAFMGGARILISDTGPKPDVALLTTTLPAPWAGAGGRYAVPDVMRAIEQANASIIFINTRAQAELFFQALWLANEKSLPIALHHGSLAREQRAKVEEAMAAGALRAVVATGSLDLGIDWGNVDQVIQIGAPHQIKRLAQRIGRSNHQFDCPSVARLVPANRFDTIECIAAIDALAEGQLDGCPRPSGPLEVLCQHILNTACTGPFDADDLFVEVKTAGPYRDLSRADFERCLDFSATGGYSLRAYERWQRLILVNGKWQLRDPRAARLLRMNIGTIIGREMVKVRTRGRGGGALGEIEESFAATLVPGDTFLIGGKTVRYDRMHELTIEVTPQPARQPKIAAFSGQTFSTSLELSTRVFDIISMPATWSRLPSAVRAWLELQARFSALPDPDHLLCESFPYQGREYLAIYGFAGRNAHQTLGLLLTRQMEALDLHPLGFLATDHALLVNSLEEVTEIARLLDAHLIAENFDEWLGETSLLRRTFRNVATIAGLLHRNQIGVRKTGKQTSFSSDIIYDALRRHEPDHLLLQATAQDIRHGLLDFSRIQEALLQFPTPKQVRLDRPSPLAAPLLLEMGRIKILGAGSEAAAQRMARKLMAESGLDTIREDSNDV